MGRFIGAIFTTLPLLYFVTYTEGASVMLTTFAILVIWIGARVGTPEHKWVRALAVNLGSTNWYTRNLSSIYKTGFRYCCSGDFRGMGCVGV